VRQTVILLAEYLVLVQAGRNKFPDPNSDKEFLLISEMLFTLIPDVNERKKIIKRIKDSVKQN
jgi:hypothetical protein